MALCLYQFGQPECVHEVETATSSVADGVAFYRGLVAKQLQREREIGELLDGKGPDVAGSLKPVGSASGGDSKRKRPPSASDGESRPQAVRLTDEEIESLKQELHSLQQSRQKIEGYLGSTRAAQSFVQEQIAAYSLTESELLRELRGDVGRPGHSSYSCGTGRRGSRRSSLGIPQRLVTFTAGYANSALPIDSLVAQIQPLREPVIPLEPPLAGPEVLEIVHYPSRSPVMEPPANFLLLAPLPAAAPDKLEDEDLKNRPKKAKEAAGVGTTRAKLKQDRG